MLKSGIKVAILALLAIATVTSTSTTAQTPDRKPTAAEDVVLQKSNAAIRAKDYVAARAFLQDPALAQYPYAHYALYSLHLQGLGGPKDEVAARISLRRAAELGHTTAMLTLAKALEKEKLPAARLEAKSWYTTASNLGDDHARGHLGQIYWDDNDPAAAFAVWSKGAGGNSFARGCAGLLYATGNGVPPDALMADYQFFRINRDKPTEGRWCIEKAADAGNARAQYVVAGWLMDKNSANYNPTKAVQLLGKASDQGHAGQRDSSLSYWIRAMVCRATRWER